MSLNGCSSGWTLGFYTFHKVCTGFLLGVGPISRRVCLHSAVFAWYNGWHPSYSLYFLFLCECTCVCVCVCVHVCVCIRPLNSHGLTVRLTVLGLFSRSHGKVLISHCHSFNLTVTHGFSLPSCLFFLWALIYKILSAS